MDEVLSPSHDLAEENQGGQSVRVLVQEVNEGGPGDHASSVAEKIRNSACPNLTADGPLKLHSTFPPYCHIDWGSPPRPLTPRLLAVLAAGQLAYEVAYK